MASQPVINRSKSLVSSRDQCAWFFHYSEFEHCLRRSFDGVAIFGGWIHCLIMEVLSVKLKACSDFLSRHYCWNLFLDSSLLSVVHALLPSGRTQLDELHFDGWEPVFHFLQMNKITSNVPYSK